MSMILIQNVSKGTAFEQTASVRTGYQDSGGGMPMFLAIPPGENVCVPDESFKDWLPGVKQWIGEYMATGVLKVYTIDSPHLYQDKGHDCIYGYDYLIDVKLGTIAETHALNMATALDTVLKLHFASLAVHGGAHGAITAALPTDLTTLIAWVTDVQTEYAVHIASTGVPPAAHPNAPVNALALGAPTTWATCIAALQEIHRVYHTHKEWTLVPGTEQDVNTIIAY